MLGREKRPQNEKLLLTAEEKQGAAGSAHSRVFLACRCRNTPTDFHQNHRRVCKPSTRITSSINTSCSSAVVFLSTQIDLLFVSNKKMLKFNRRATENKTKWFNRIKPSRTSSRGSRLSSEGTVSAAGRSWRNETRCLQMKTKTDLNRVGSLPAALQHTEPVLKVLM